MDTRSFPKFCCALLLVLWLAACNVFTEQTAEPTPDRTAIAATILAGIGATLTQDAKDATQAVPTAEAFTETPTLTPTLEISPTPKTVTVSVSVDTNCRTGPARVYDYLGGLLSGETAEVVARNAASDYWYIRNPDIPGGFCWLFGKYATVTGNTSVLPVFTPMPTPTPMPNFTLEYDSLDTCSGWYVNFKVTNTGGSTFRSYYIKVTDNLTNTTINYQADNFNKTSGCADIKLYGQVEKGASAFVHAYSFTYDPTGHGLSAAVMICTEKGLAGTCVTKRIDVTVP
jgi:hypothetical protein